MQTKELKVNSLIQEMGHHVQQLAFKEAECSEMQTLLDLVKQKNLALEADNRKMQSQNALNTKRLSEMQVEL